MRAVLVTTRCTVCCHRTPHDVRAVVACPQFKHQLHVLSAALKTGQFDFTQFGLPPEAQVGLTL